MFFPVCWKRAVHRSTEMVHTIVSYELCTSFLHVLVFQAYVLSYAAMPGSLQRQRQNFTRADLFIKP